jgi:hypothetical protein
MSPTEYKIVFKVRLATDLLRGNIPPSTRRTNRAAVRFAPTCATRAAKETALDILEPYGVDLEHDDDDEIRVLVDRLDSYSDQSLYRILIRRLVNPFEWPFVLMVPPEHDSPTHQRVLARDFSTQQLRRRPSSRELRNIEQQREALGLDTPAQLRAEAGRLIDDVMDDPSVQERPAGARRGRPASRQPMTEVRVDLYGRRMAQEEATDDIIEDVDADYDREKQERIAARRAAKVEAKRQEEQVQKKPTRRLIIKKKRPPVISDE